MTGLIERWGFSLVHGISDFSIWFNSNNLLTFLKQVIIMKKLRTLFDWVRVVCGACNGTGTLTSYNGKTITCTACDGKGYSERP